MISFASIFLFPFRDLAVLTTAIFYHFSGNFTIRKIHKVSVFFLAVLTNRTTKKKPNQTAAATTVWFGLRDGAYVSKHIYNNLGNIIVPLMCELNVKFSVTSHSFLKISDVV